MLLNCGVGEDCWESLGLQGDATSLSWRKSILNIHWKDWCWSWSSNPLATWYEELIDWKRPWCWEKLKAGEEDNRGWDGWMASPIRWTWVWASSGSWWWIEKPGVLQSIGSQRVEHDWATELTEFKVQKKPQGSNIKLWNEGWICGCVFWGIPWHILQTYVNGTQEWRERESFHEFI